MSNQELIDKFKEKYEELPDNKLYKHKLKEFIELMELEEKEEKLNTNNKQTDEPKPIEIDESLLADAVRIWFDGKLFKD